MTHPRSIGRELALQYLYMFDVLEGKDVPGFDVYLSHQQPVPDNESVMFARKMVESVLGHREELDKDIADVATNWNIARMAAVDRNILRLGLAEMTVHPDTSHKIILNEAVELAKCYSSDEAGAFVNGLLDKLRTKLRPDTVG
ncbi:MAG TPA: transcription antitermination factor NusB [Planctomycetota bacterium]|jgi:N utilization substance protein B